jgi:hypothetical protein
MARRAAGYAMWMDTLNRIPFLLPTLVIAILLALLLGGCDGRPPATGAAAEPAKSNVYLEAVQEAEALKHSLEERRIEQERLDALLGRDQSATR